MLRLALIQLVNAGIEVNALIHDGIIVSLDKKKFRKQFIKAKKILEDASRKILNKDKKTNYMCPVDFQVFRYGMIQDKSEQEKYIEERSMSEKEFYEKYNYHVRNNNLCLNTI